MEIRESFILSTLRGAFLYSMGAYSTFYCFVCFICYRPFSALWVPIVQVLDTRKLGMIVLPTQMTVPIVQVLDTR